MRDRKISHADLVAFAGRVVNLPREIAEEKRRQVNILRERLTKHIAENPGFSLVKMLHAGSVAKGTALRTFNDFDVAVHVKKADAPTPEAELLEGMAARLREAYGLPIDPVQIQARAALASLHINRHSTRV